MYLLYCDESNVEEREGDFLLYAGVSIPPSTAKQLSDEIELIRKRASVPDDFRLKFNPGPPHLSHQEFIALKKAILESAVANGVRLFAYVILHDVAKGKGMDVARRNGINTVCFHFDCYLNRVKDQGIVLLDRFQDRGNRIDDHTREKFSIGLVGLPYSPTKRLSNILGVHYSTVGQSHFCSLVDIIVGSLRFSINSYSRGQTEFHESAAEILNVLSPLFFREEGWDGVSELGLQFSPKVVRKNAFRAKYAGLKQFLADRGVDTVQRITNQREY
jgi:hypothetical protein